MRKCEYIWGLESLPQGVQDQSPCSGVRVALPPETDDISAFWDYICEVNVTPEFKIMEVYLSRVP